MRTAREAIDDIKNERRYLFRNDGVYHKTSVVFTLELGSVAHRIEDFDRAIAAEQRREAEADFDAIARYRRLASYAAALRPEVEADLKRELTPAECGGGP